MTAGSIPDGGTVLTGVKAKPSGWPAASPDPGSGRCRLAAIETAAQTNQDQISPKRSLYGSRGLPLTAVDTGSIR
jgi:hypothetical protein